MKITNINVLFGNKNHQKTKIKQKQQTTQNLNKEVLLYNTNYLSSITFKGVENKLTPSQNKAIDFGLYIVKKLKTEEKVDITKEVEVFLAQNDLKNIKVKPLSEATAATEKTAGGFVPDLDENLNFIGGTLYLAPVPKTKDEKAIQRYASVLAHEIQHAFEESENTTKKIAEKNEISAKNMQLILGFTTIMQNYFSPTLRNKPLQYCVDNYKILGIPIYEVKAFNPDIRKYGTVFPLKSLRSISKDTIYNAFNGKANFTKNIEKYFFETINTYNNSPDLAIFRTPNAYKALKDYYAYSLRNEAKAYQVNSEIHKKLNNLNQRFYTLNDLTPLTFNIVADELDKINIKNP